MERIERTTAALTTLVTTEAEHSLLLSLSLSFSHALLGASKHHTAFSILFSKSKTNKNLKNRGRFHQQKITSPGVGDYLFTRLKNVSSQFKLACRQKCTSIDPEAGKCRLLCADFRAWGRRVTDACQLSSPWRRHRSVLASGSGKSRVLARTRTHTHIRTHTYTYIL